MSRNLALLALCALLTMTGCAARHEPRAKTQPVQAAPARPAAPAMQAQEPALYPNETPQLRRLINKWADHYEIPRALVHRQAIRESAHRPRARNGPYWGLLQILPQTARTMGHRGPPEELLDPDINLKYAGKYLRGAWIVSGGDIDAAMMWYAKGYYYEAKRLGLLEETCLKGCAPG